jgi:type VI secretion system secreted protein Hcp
MSILMSVVGAQQGQIYGPGPNREWNVLSYSNGITTPYDANSGLPTGRRVHQPVSISAAYGENITAFMTSITNAEDLTVTITHLDDTTGDVLIRMTLSGGQLFECDWSGSSGGDDTPTESLSFTFQKIVVASGNANYSDTWEGGSTTGA